MSVCRHGGRALKGRVSLLRRVTEQSDGSQRAENNSHSLCTPRRKQWNQPTTRTTTDTHTRARIKPLFRPAFISVRQTVSGVRLSTFLCVNSFCYFCCLSYLCACIRLTFIFLYIHIPALSFLMFTRYSVLWQNWHSGMYTSAAQWEAATTATCC